MRDFRAQRYRINGESEIPEGISSLNFGWEFLSFAQKYG